MEEQEQLGSHREEEEEQEEEDVGEDFVSEAELQKAVDPEGPAPAEQGEEEEAEGGEVGEAAEGPGMTELPDDSVQGFFDHSDNVFCVAINPRLPELVVSGGADDRGFIWNNQTGERVAELGGHEDSVAAVAWNFDGTYCATGGLDGKIKIWNERGELVQTLEGPSGGIPWLQWHPRGNALLAGSEDCSTWLWLAPLNKNVAVFFGHTGTVECGAWKADGKLCVTGSEDCSLRIWLPKDGSCAHVIQGHTFHRAPIVQVAVAPSETGSAILSGDADGELFLSNFDGKIKGPLKGHEDSIECIRFSPSLPLAVTGSMDRTLRVWDLGTLSCRQVIEMSAGVLHLNWHREEQKILVSTGGKVILYEARTLEVLREWAGPTSIVNDLAVAADWSRFITAEDDGPCLVFSMDKSK